MSLILRLLSVICCMLATTWPTTSPPRAAAWAAVPASWLAWRAVSADWVTVAVSCSMLAAVSSRLEAVCSVRADRSWLPLAICTDADDTESTPERTSVTTPRSCVDMADNERSIWPNSSLRVERSSCVRSPAAMASMALTAWSSGRVMERTSCGACQGSCRLIYAAKGCLRSAFMWSATTESRSGLRVTAPIGDQSRVVPDQRAGLRSRALRYSSCRAARMA